MGLKKVMWGSKARSTKNGGEMRTRRLTLPRTKITRENLQSRVNANLKARWS